MSDPRNDELGGLSATATGGRGKGVRRINRKPLIVFLAVILVVLLVFAYSAMQRAANIQTGHATKGEPVTGANAGKAMDGLPEAGEIAAKRSPVVVAPVLPGAAPTAVAVAPAGPTHPDYSQAWQSYQQATEQVEQQRRQKEAAALTSPPAVNLASNNASVNSSNKPSAPTPPRFPGITMPGQQQAADPNYAKDKTTWANSGDRDHTDYLTSMREPPISPYEIKTGTVIPGVMIGGINSDLPGQIVGQVRENVYDTATGHHLLIPQGARLVGTYDNEISRGQTRVLVAWNRIVFPDASAIDLAHFAGTDQAGYAGFADKVNTHMARVFSDALLMSLFSAGIQLSQPQASNGQNINSSQIIAGSLGQQLGETGMQIVQRDINIQPTITVRPGYHFQVMVTRDMILPLWQGAKG